MRNWLINIRNSKGLTQKVVAAKCGLTQGYYSMIENGERGQAIPLSTAQRIADVLGFPVDKFNNNEPK